MQKIKLPEIFIRNKVNMRFTNFTYEDEAEYQVDTLLFKDIAKNGVSAFEIIKNNNNDSLNPYQLQVVGEIDLTKLFELNETNISFFANINNLKLREGKISLPDIKFSGQGELNSQGELKTNIELRANDLLQMRLNAL